MNWMGPLSKIHLVKSGRPHLSCDQGGLHSPVSGPAFQDQSEKSPCTAWTAGSCSEHTSGSSHGPWPRSPAASAAAAWNSLQRQSRNTESKIRVLYDRRTVPVLGGLG